MSAEQKNALEFENVSKDFAGAAGATAPIIGNLSFTIKQGEFFSFLGPSGCGKTTCLRMISGLERPSSGTIRINGHVVNDVHPHQRNVHMVFQKYALFPHLNVFDNVAFGLRMKKLPATQVKARVDRMLAMVKLDLYSNRMIQQLSGGEQQRVALVRALVNEPAILLLDEPLGALDLKLREQMQVELVAIQKQLKTTFIFVTHDQGEALTLSDRIAIMNKGRIEQIGTPNEIYENPATSFAAHFVGSTNTFTGKVTAAEAGSVSLETAGYGTMVVRSGDRADPAPGAGERCQIVVRPEKIRIRVSGPDKPTDPSSPTLNSFRGVLLERTYFGPTTQIKLQVNESAPPLVALIANQTAHKMPHFKLGERYYAVWDAADSGLFKLDPVSTSPEGL